MIIFSVFTTGILKTMGNTKLVKLQNVVEVNINRTKQTKLSFAFSSNINTAVFCKQFVTGKWCIVYLMITFQVLVRILLVYDAHIYSANCVVYSCRRIEFLFIDVWFCR